MTQANLSETLFKPRFKHPETSTLVRRFSHGAQPPVQLSLIHISAKPFFERYGFQTVKQQRVECRGTWFTNFYMRSKPQH